MIGQQRSHNKEIAGSNPAPATAEGRAFLLVGTRPGPNRARLWARAVRGTGDPRRLVGSLLVPHVHSIVGLVLLEAADVDLCIHLDSRNAAALTPGPAHEFRMEVRSAIHIA